MSGFAPTVAFADALQPLGVAGAWILLASLLAEPARRQSQALIVGVAAGAYMDGGLGVWELGFTVLVGLVAYRGLCSYRWIACGWALHTGWDILHHAVGRPMISWQPLSSFNCAITDAVLAVWFLAGAPSVWAGRRLFASRRRSSESA